MNKLTVYSASWCQHCGPYKEMLVKNNIPFDVVDMDDEGATKQAFKLGIRSLPTSIIHSPTGEVLLTVSGSEALPQIKQLMVNDNG